MIKDVPEKISRLSGLINRNSGWLIATAIVFFGLAIVSFQKDNQRLLSDTNAAVKNTESIISKQDETLEAIKQLALDSKLTAKQLGDTIICMLQVPISQRTTDVQENCRKQALNITPAPSTSSGATAPSQKAPEPSKPQEQSNTPEQPKSLPQQALDRAGNIVEFLWSLPSKAGGIIN